VIVVFIACSSGDAYIAKDVLVVVMAVISI
jgi:hypothetical protein